MENTRTGIIHRALRTLTSNFETMLLEKLKLIKNAATMYIKVTTINISPAKKNLEDLRRIDLIGRLC